MKFPLPQRRPLLFSILLLLIILVTYLIAGAITFQFKLPALTIIIIGDGVLALIAILLLSRLHWWREAGFRLPSNPRNLWWFTVPCLPIILNIAFAGVSYPGMARIVLFFILALAVGFVEEVFFRGLMLRALLFRGRWQAVIISSLFFGIAHLFNLASGANLAATLLQVVYALAIGLMFAALAVRTQTILPLIVIHGLTDFFGFLALNSTVVTAGVSTFTFVTTAGEIVAYIVYSILLMRQVKPQAHEVDMGKQFAFPLKISG
jgi:uncharacterized protein